LSQQLSKAGGGYSEANKNIFMAKHFVLEH
jgi:hypothetical protein